MKRLKLIIFCLTFIISKNLVDSSVGDKSPYFQNCLSSCIKLTCQQNVLLYKKGMEISIADHLIEMWKYKKFEVKDFENIIPWNCHDECRYRCIHKTTEAFLARRWEIPQFNGKWPFVRLFGLQEPASVIFSALNFYSHIVGIKKFRQKVRSDSPLYVLWHTFSFICLNAWVWSMVFHARDFPMTELFDYVFAYSMVLASFWCMLIRVIHSRSPKLTGIVTTMCVLFFSNHFAYLSYNTFDYSYNMKVNIFTGIMGGIGWIFWCLSQIRKRKYVWKMLVFVSLAMLSVILEIYDFPPILWSFDAHSLWHLSSAPITFIFYNFIIEDCNQLRKDSILSDDKRKLL